MASATRSYTQRETYGMLMNTTGTRYVAVAVALTIGLPLVVYLAGSRTWLFYMHVALGAFWFGLDLFFKFVLGPSLAATDDESAGAVQDQLVPRMVLLAEPLSIGVIGSGIALAHLLGYWANPTHWLWGALGIGIVMLAIGFGPLHAITSKMIVENAQPEPDGEKLDALFGSAMKWGLAQSVLMLAIIGMMTGIRAI